MEKFTNFKKFLEAEVYPHAPEGRQTFYRSVMDNISPLEIKAYVETELRPRENDLSTWIDQFEKKEMGGEIVKKGISPDARFKLRRYCKMFLEVCAM